MLNQHLSNKFKERELKKDRTFLLNKQNQYLTYHDSNIRNIYQKHQHRKLAKY